MSDNGAKIEEEKARLMSLFAADTNGCVVPRAPQIQALISQGLTPAEAAASLQFDNIVAVAEAAHAKSVIAGDKETQTTRVNTDALDLTDDEKGLVKQQLLAAVYAGDRTTARFLYARNQVSADNRYKSKLPGNSPKLVILNQLAASANARSMD